MDEHLPPSHFRPELQDLPDILRELEKKSAKKFTVSSPTTAVELSIGTISPQISSGNDQSCQTSSETPFFSSLVASTNSEYIDFEYSNIQSEVLSASQSPCVSSYIQTLTDFLSSDDDLPSLSYDPSCENHQDEAEIGAKLVSRSQNWLEVSFKRQLPFSYGHRLEETYMASTTASSIFQGMSTSSTREPPDSTRTLDSLTCFSGSEVRDHDDALIMINQDDGAGCNIERMKKQVDKKCDNIADAMIKPICKVEKKGERGPRYAFRTRSHVEVMDDGYRWRKYGQKFLKESPYPRRYYRCTSMGCPVKKRVERSAEDNGLVITTYEDIHTHHSPPSAMQLQDTQGYSLMSSDQQNRESSFSLSWASTVPTQLPLLDRSTSQLQQAFADAGLLQDVTISNTPKSS